MNLAWSGVGVEGQAVVRWAKVEGRFAERNGPQAWPVPSCVSLKKHTDQSESKVGMLISLSL